VSLIELASQAKLILSWLSIMVHEVPDVKGILREIASLLKSRGKLLIVEPVLHVSASSFKKTLEAAQLAGLQPISEPKIRFCRSMLFQLA